MKRDYEMTEAQLAKLLEACKSVPYMVFGGMEPRSPQQNANDAWASLGGEMGFKWDTVEPTNRGNRFFRAEPLELQS